MSDPLFKQIAVVGVGLLGGSLGLAVKQQKLCTEVVGIGRSQGSLEDALRLEAVDRVSLDIRQGVAEADLVVLCTPVRHILSVLPEVMEAVKPGAIVTDVGSTKASITSLGEELAGRHGKLFVGSHPMAGSEKSGVRFAKPTIYENSTCFVTKTPETDLRAFARVSALWSALGARIVVVRPDRHDSLASLVSHLAHLVAVALVRTVELTHEDRNLIKGIIGNGFRDTTRIACGNVQMWEDIFADNEQRIAGVQEALQQVISEIISAQRTDHAALHNLFEQACDFREFLANH